MDLDSFVAAAEPTRIIRCSGCQVRASRPDLWEQVLAGRARRPVPHSFRTIVRFLKSQGVDLPYNRIRDHFRAHEETL